jgi:hypothetical protein
MEQRFVTAMHFIGHMLGDIHPIGRQESAHSFGSLHVKKDRQKKQNEKQGCCCRDQINKRKSLA